MKLLYPWRYQKNEDFEWNAHEYSHLDEYYETFVKDYCQGVIGVCKRSYEMKNGTVGHGRFLIFDFNKDQEFDSCEQRTINNLVYE